MGIAFLLGLRWLYGLLVSFGMKDWIQRKYKGDKEIEVGLVGGLGGKLLLLGGERLSLRCNSGSYIDLR